MSQKIITETLKGLQLTDRDAEVYISLAKKGPILARDITKAFKINKAQVYRSLKNLQSKGIVQATLETPSSFTAMPFEKVYDLYVKLKKDEAQKIEQSRKAVLEQWHSIALQKATELPDRFMVIEGKNFIYTKSEEMIKKAQKEALISTNSATIIESDLNDTLQSFVNPKITSKVVTEITKTNCQYMAKIFSNLPKTAQAKHIDITGEFFPRFVLVDDTELLFFTSGSDTNLKNQIDNGLWTNNKPLIHSFRAFFNQLWQAGIDIEEKIQQLKTGQEPSKNIIIKDPHEAYKLFISILNSTQNEIIIITTEEDLPILAANKEFLNTQQSKGIDIKILAPTTEKNKDTIEEIKKYGQIRHIQANYFRTVIIDRKHLFQFKKTQTNKTEIPNVYFESLFYTNDPEFAKGRYDLLMELWEHAPEEIEKIKLNETRFRSIYENNQDAIILATPNGEVITANTAALKMFGMTIEEMKKANRQKMLVLDQKANKAIKEREENGYSKAELTYKRKDGSTFDAETTASNFTDIDGEIKNCITIRDITKLKQNEKALEQSQDRLQAMFNYINIGVAIVDAEGWFAYSNYAYQQIMGYSQEELEIKSFLEITHPEDRPKMKKLYKELLQGKIERATVEKRNVTKDDDIIWVRLNISVMSRNQKGKPIEFITTLEDITQQHDLADSHKAQEMLRESQERFQTIINNSTDLIYRINLQTGHYEFVSPASKRILGYEPQEIANMSNEEVLATVHPDDLQQLQMDLAKLMKEGKAVAEYRIKRKDGTYIWYRNTMYLTHDTNGRPLYRDGYCREITEKTNPKKLTD